MQMKTQKLLTMHFGRMLTYELKHILGISSLMS